MRLRKIMGVRTKYRNLHSGEGKRAFSRSNLINYKCPFETPFSILFTSAFA